MAVKDTAPKTNHKAVIGAIGTFLALLAAMWGYGEPPDTVDVELAVETGSAVILSVLNGLAIWYKANYYR